MNMGAPHANGKLGKGYVQVYTGEGKGKTTAALGLSLRAAGAGLRVFFAQFVKGRATSEMKALESLCERITLRQYGRENFVLQNPPDPADVAAAQKGLEEVRKIIDSGDYSVVVLDEANVAVHLGLLSAGDILGLIDEKPDCLELVITGRNAPKEILERADLVTEMKEVRHYSQQGVKARTGIEK